MNKFQNLIDTLRNKQNHVNRENQKFADEADRLIDKLKESIGGGLFSKQLEKEDFSELKGLASEIFDLIKKNRFPSKEQRIAAWDKFNNLRDRLRKEEDEYYSKIREKITKRIDHSQELTNKIINTIDACHPNSSLDDLFELLGKLVLYLTGIGFLIDAVEWLLGIKEEKPKNPLKVKSDALRDVRKFINENKEDITREDKQKIYARLDIVQADLNNAWDEYKKELQRKREEWEERKKLREQKQVEWERRQKEYQQKKINWEKNQREFLEKLADRLEKQNSFKEKLENIYEKQKEFLDKLEKRLDNQQDFLRKLNDQLDDLEDKYSSAWSNNFRDRVSDWIDDKKSKISEVEDDIAGIENKIRDVKNNIDELPNKIRGVEKSIDEIENKIYEVRAKL